MAPDCVSPKCHEAMKLCIDKKVPKKTLWIVCWSVFVVICIPLFITGIQVWSQQESDFLRYAAKDDVEQCKQDQAGAKTALKHLSDEMKELKALVVTGQKEFRADNKEILKYLRDLKR